MKKTKLISVLFWSARIISLLIISITLLFFIGSLLAGQGKESSHFTLSTILIFIIWGLGLIGLLIAIWKPGTGGIISIICFLVFNLLVALSSTSKYSIVLLIFMIPSVLFFVTWWLKKSAINNLKS